MLREALSGRFQCWLMVAELGDGNRAMTQYYTAIVGSAGYKVTRDCK